MTVVRDGPPWDLFTGSRGSPRRGAPEGLSESSGPPTVECPTVPSFRRDHAQEPTVPVHGEREKTGVGSVGLDDEIQSF